MTRLLGPLRDKKPDKYPEIMDDFRSVQLLLARLRSARLADSKPGSRAFTYIQLADECLQRAAEAPLLEEKWSCLNQANAQLALACRTRDEQSACMLRLKNLFPLLTGFKDRLPEPFKSFTPATTEVKMFNPRRAYEVLETAAQGWHLVNEQNAFSTRIWTNARRILSTLLIIALLVTEAITWEDSPVKLQYLWSALFGTFGGALSVLLGSRNSFVSATTYRVSRSQAYMRILLGGAGAFIVVLAIRSGLVFKTELAMLLDAFPALALVSIASGFSERLFLTALERVAGTISEARPQAGGDDKKSQVQTRDVSGPSDAAGLLAEADEEDSAAQLEHADNKAARTAASQPRPGSTNGAANAAFLRQLDREDEIEQANHAKELADRATAGKPKKK